MRVLTIAQLLRQPPGQDCRLGKRDPFLAPHPLGDSRVIGRRQGIGLARQHPTHCCTHRPALGRELSKHLLVIGRVGHHRHGLMIFGSGTNQGHPADIDALDTIYGIGSRGDRLGKGIKVADDEVDWRNPPLGKCREIIQPVASRQEAGMDYRVEGLHPAVEDLRKTGDLRYLRDGQPGCSECPRRPAGRNQGDIARDQRGGEGNYPRLVADRKERTLGHRRGFRIEGRGNGTPAAASAACWRAASAASSKSSISSWKSWYQLITALRCMNTEPSPIAARSIKTNSRGGLIPPRRRISRCTLSATLAPYAPLRFSWISRSRSSSSGP